MTKKTESLAEILSEDFKNQHNINKKVADILLNLDERLEAIEKRLSVLDGKEARK